MARTSLVVSALITLVFSHAAQAQSLAETSSQSGRVWMRPPELPSTEVGLHIGIWTLMDGGAEFGGHVTRNRSDWFALEYGVTRRPAGLGRPSSAMLEFGMRFAVPLPDPRDPMHAFLTLGAAAGNSANFSVSPMIGGGILFMPGPYRRPGLPMIRVEIQIFPRGKPVDDRGRLMVGMIIPIGRR
jgi:hypothetical protein